MRFRALLTSCIFGLSATIVHGAIANSNSPAPLSPEESAILQAPPSTEPIAPLAPAPQLAGEETMLDQSGLFRLISPTGYLDYDEQNNLIYTREHAKVEYQGMSLEADRMIFDMNLQEVQAEGNVTLVLNGQTVQAEAMRFNFKDKSGLAMNAHGQMGVLRFSISDKSGHPSFQQVSPDVSVIRNIGVTTDDFPIPMYELRAKEATVLQNKRVLLKSVRLIVRGVPVMYLPYYSRSLQGSVPWFVQFGTSSRSGVFARLGYTYHHERLVPSMTEDGKTVIDSKGRARVWADYYSRRGLGAGADYDYMFGQGRHDGHAELYTVPSDSARNVRNEDTSSRWEALMHHRSLLSRGLYLQLNVDAVSDPEVYYDLLDNFNNLERGRVPERGGSAALTLNREDYIARIRMEIKDRIGRDRFSDFSDPNDNNRDFDVEPGQRDKDDQGISRDRWGRVSLKAPEINIASNYIRLARSNFYYRAQLNLFNNLDRGLNIVSNGDFTARDADYNALYDGHDPDAMVQGLDFYNNIMHVHRFSDRVTWTNKVGVGAGVAQRTSEDEDMVDGSRGFADSGVLINPGTGSSSGYYDGLYFTDPRTFHIGQSDALFSYDDVQPGFAYADYESRLQARITDALNANVRYTGRATSGDYLGDWYARLGDQSFRTDLYDFPLRTNWLEASLDYSLFYPNINLYTRGGRNLTSTGDLWPNEMLWYYTPIGASYTSPDQSIIAGSALTFLEQQYYYPTDPRAYTSKQVRWGNDIEYRDPGEQWWLRLATAWRNNLNQSLNDTDSTSLFEEGDNRFEISPSFGTRVGPKWTVVGSTTYDSRLSALDGASFSFNRDLHDALLGFRIRLREEVFSRQDRQDEGKGGSLNNLDLSVSISPKLPQQNAPLGRTRRSTLDQRFRTSRLEFEG